MTLCAADVPIRNFPPRNRLLAQIAPPDYQRLAPHLRVIALAPGQVLYRQGESPRDIYFLGGGICSLMKTMDDGATAELATIGNEGVVGAFDEMSGAPAAAEARVQVSDRRRAIAMPFAMFEEELAGGGSLSLVISAYLLAFIKEVQQRVACNALHSAEQRTCSWLLTTHDRVALQAFSLTHESLAHALGVRRPTITQVLAALQRRGFVSYRRGRMTILDRDAMEAAACGCSQIVKAHYRRIGMS